MISEHAVGAELEKLDNDTRALVENAVRLFSDCLREAGLQQAIVNLPKGTLGRFDIEPLATRPKGGSPSLLSISLIFGRSAKQRWTALRRGHQTPSLFPAAAKDLLRFLGQDPSTVSYELSISNALNRHPSIAEKLAIAEGRYLAIYSYDQREALFLRLKKSVLSKSVGKPLQQELLAEFSYDEVEQITLHPIELPEMRLSSALARSDYRINRFARGWGVWSPAVTAALIRDGARWSPKVMWESGKFRATERRIGWKKILDGKRRGDVAFNSGKAAFRTDMILDEGKLPSRIVLWPTEYVDTLSSNDVAANQVDEITRRPNGTIDPDKTLLVGTDLFLERDGTLVSYSDSRCANQLGVSTLAITDDGVPLLIHQLEKNLQSKNLTAPSGSGSLDYPADFNTLQAGQPWNEWLLWTAQRELREELGIAVHDAVDGEPAEWMQNVAIRMLPVGFGGLLHRGGKPDFFFLARVSCTVETLIQNSRYSAAEKSLSALLVDHKAMAMPGLSAASLRLFCEHQVQTRADKTSVPLSMLYAMLIHATASLEDEIDGFLGSLDESTIAAGQCETESHLRDNKLSPI